MIWNELLILASDGVAESVSDTSNDFFHTYPVKMYASTIQTQASRTICCLEGSHTITTVAGTSSYTLPPDFIKPTGAKYGSLYFMKETWRRPQVAQSVSGTPVNYWVESNTINFYPTPDAVETITLYYKKLAPPYALLFKASGLTAATVEVKPTYIEINTTGGAQPGTYTFAFATYTSLTTLAAAINADAHLSAYITVTLCSTAYPTTGSVNLETVPATSILPNKLFFLDPVIPEEMQTSILLNAMLFKMKSTDREVALAKMYYQLMQDAIQEYYVRWKERYSGTANLTLENENIGLNVYPHGSGGFIVVP